MEFAKKTYNCSDLLFNVSTLTVYNAILLEFHIPLQSHEKLNVLEFAISPIDGVYSVAVNSSSMKNLFAKCLFYFFIQFDNIYLIIVENSAIAIFCSSQWFFETVRATMN